MSLNVTLINFILTIVSPLAVIFYLSKSWESTARKISLVLIMWGSLRDLVPFVNFHKWHQIAQSITYATFHVYFVLYIRYVKASTFSYANTQMSRPKWMQSVVMATTCLFSWTSVTVKQIWYKSALWVNG